MNTNQKFLVIALAVAVGAVVFFMTFNLAGPAVSTLSLASFQAATSTPRATAAPSGEAIPLKPLTDLTSLNATVKLNVNGLMKEKRAQGDLTALLTTNDQNKSKITVSGSLLGDIAAQVGGSIVGL